MLYVVGNSRSCVDHRRPQTLHSRRRQTMNPLQREATIFDSRQMSHRFAGSVMAGRPRAAFCETRAVFGDNPDSSYLASRPLARAATPTLAADT